MRSNWPRLNASLWRRSGLPLTEGAGPAPLAPPPHPNSPVAEPNPGFLAAVGVNQVSLSPESWVLSPTWHSFNHRSGVTVVPAPGQRPGSLHSRCLSAWNTGAQLWPVPSLQHSSFQTFCHRIFPNETSPLPVQLGSGHLELLSLSTTSFLSQHELPSTGPEFLHHVTSPTFQDTNLPSSSPLLSLLSFSYSFFFTLPSPPLPFFFPKCFESIY